MNINKYISKCTWVCITHWFFDPHSLQPFSETCKECLVVVAFSETCFFTSLILKNPSTENTNAGNQLTSSFISTGASKNVKKILSNSSMWKHFPCYTFFRTIMSVNVFVFCCWSAFLFVLLLICKILLVECCVDKTFWICIFLGYLTFTNFRQISFLF